VIKSRRIRLAGHVDRVGERRVVYRVLVGNPEGKRTLGSPDVDGRIILR
jgi:acyl-coenzyme A thioesterase PaaI-like protein